MDGHVGLAGGEAEFDRLVGEQAQGPAGVDLGGVGNARASSCDSNCPLKTISREGRAWGLRRTGGLESFLDEALLAVFNGPDSAADSLGDIGDMLAGPVGTTVAK